MNALFVSMCRHKAGRRSSRILDAYALRTGERTWMTAISEEGLQVLHEQLRRGASRNSAVACWVTHAGRAPDLRWTVGASNAFGPGGQVPVGITGRYGRFDLNGEPVPRDRAGRAKLGRALLPLPLRIASLLALCAGLVHDLGKYGPIFDAKLLRAVKREGANLADPVRHEWISLHLIRGDLQGLPRRLAERWSDLWHRPLIRWDPSRGEPGEGEAFVGGIQDAKTALDYLVFTHHRLPAGSSFVAAGAVDTGVLCDATYIADPSKWDDVMQRGPKLAPEPETVREIGRSLARLARCAAELPSMDESTRTTFWRAVALLARSSLIQADHRVSALDMPDPALSHKTTAFANTTRVAGRPVFNQPLDWHLRNVGRQAGQGVGRMLAYAPRGLSGQVLDGLARPSEGRFQWQTRAALRLQEDQKEAALPTLVLNFAGTGSGKTRMNAVTMAALRQGQPVRFVTAVNLRTLTLQTRDVYAAQMGMKGDDMACVIGCAVTEQLHDADASTGSARSIPNQDVDEDGNPAEELFEAVGTPERAPAWLDHFLVRNPKMASVVTSPVVVCTSDFVVAAGDPTQKLANALANIRLMRSDLVLDEIDGYDPKGFAAICRLVTAAATWGRHVIASSATLARPIALGLFEAYKLGFEMGRALGTIDAVEWRQSLVDDGAGLRSQKHQDAALFSRWYEDEVKTSLGGLGVPRLRPVELLELAAACGVDGAEVAIFDRCGLMHRRHAVEIAIEKDAPPQRVSIGLVRVANIKTARRLARRFARMPAQDGRGHHVTCYHARLPRIQRYRLERALDQMLKLDAEPGARQRALLGSLEAMERMRSDRAAGLRETLLIVIATPVEEVGRDHDFDYAVIEPSSTQSIVQCAGRVNRHRLVPCTEPNVAIMQFNFRALDRKGLRGAVFTRPGLEREGALYPSHDLGNMLDWSRLQDVSENGCGQVDARMRFETDRHAFAKCDDVAQSQAHRRFAGPFHESRCDSWVGQMLYLDAPLRDGEPKELWTVDAAGAFRRSELATGWRGRELVDRSNRIAPARPIGARAWLWWPRHELRRYAEARGVTISDAFAVEVHPLAHDDQLDWDEAVGVASARE